MNSFTLTAVGNLARDPEPMSKGGTAYTRFCLVGNDFAGKDERGKARELITTLYFVAFNGLGETIAKHARKGDQLVLLAHVRANNWTDEDGRPRFDHTFVVRDFRFGAPGKLRREETANRDEGEFAALLSET